MITPIPSSLRASKAGQYKIRWISQFTILLFFFSKAQQLTTVHAHKN